jgi:uncharacterized protein
VAGALGLGLAWGWLPCGLSYSMLLLAATTASATAGALVMAAFGVGTLPAMVTAPIALECAARALATRASLRKVAGVLLVAFGAWTAGNALYHALARSGHAGHSMAAPDAAQPEAAPDDPHAHHQHPQ